MQRAGIIILTLLKNSEINTRRGSGGASIFFVLQSTVHLHFKFNLFCPGRSRSHDFRRKVKLKVNEVQLKVSFYQV